MDDEVSNFEEEDDLDGDAMQSASQREWGERLKDFKWRLEQEKKIELFRSGRGELSCKEVQRLKMMGLGLGVKHLIEAMFGSSSTTEAISSTVDSHN